MFRDVAFGQYYPGDSLVHRLDPRTKLIFVILFIASVFFVDTFVGYAVILGFVLVSIVFSRVPFLKVLKSLKGIILLVLFTAILNVFFYKQGRVLLHWTIFTITEEGLIFAAKMALRLSLLVVGATLLTLTTTPMGITDGMESLMSPLKLLKIRVHDIAVIMSIALRFIPSLIEETDKIMLAQKARGADFDTGGLIKKAKAMLPILIPLFVSAFRHADELALALDARCYNATEKRTKLKKLILTWRDAVASVFVLIFFALILFIKYDWFFWFGGII